MGKLKGHTYCQSGYLKEKKKHRGPANFYQGKTWHACIGYKCRKKNRWEFWFEPCPLCKTESESADHFLLRCPKFSDRRQHFINGIVPFEPIFDRMNSDANLKTMLNLECTPPEARHLVIEFITNTYKQRRSLAILTTRVRCAHPTKDLASVFWRPMSLYLENAGLV